QSLEDLHDAPIKKIFFADNRMFSIDGDGNIIVCAFNKTTDQYEKTASHYLGVSVDLIVGVGMGEFAIVDKAGKLNLVSLDFKKLLTLQSENNNNNDNEFKAPTLT